MKRLGLALLFVSVASMEGRAAAYSHIVLPGESLAQIAERTYGDSVYESVLVGANALDVQGGSLIVPGMRIEVPSPTYHRIIAGETWKSLAASFLGARADAKSDARAAVLARANDSLPWIAPIEGQEIEVPAVVTHIASEGETMTGLAKRYWDKPNSAWELNAYNDREGADLKRGEIVLVPMPKLKLTAAGKLAARQAAERDGAASGGAVLDLQRDADSAEKLLLSDVRDGQYIDAVALGNRLLGGGGLTHPQLARIYRALLEAYVALGATKAAVDACAAWRKNEPAPVLDPVRVSPKIREACDAP